MQILISSVGTRGDVEPALALASALREKGHSARLCVPPNFVAEARRLGFTAAPIGIEMRAPRPGETPPPVPDLVADQFDTVAAEARGCDLIVGAGAHQYAARSIAELGGIPCVIAVYAPTALPGAEPGWSATQDAWNARALDRVNANRRRLGLAVIDDVLTHILGEQPWLAADPVLGPAPPGSPVVQTGAWIRPDAAALPQQLLAFLEAGDPPIYLGFGSMPAAPDAGRALVAAARAVRRRSILARGWAGLELTDAAPDCFVVDEVNHQALFPRVAAVVHHAGAGTTVAAARAGTPQVAVPMFSDQFYWARRIRELGLGASIPFADLGSGSLADRLREALAPDVRQRARDTAGRITPDGAAIAATRLVEMA